ncbi:MAG TPA: alpha/beta hydrolase [Candidatus Angelobacter sp.]|jgi:pimeloyl-ACP methyl ester carboxylesterase|nr:alpha/beta hydrolase [Candidatus Angelobacter sp.]
MPKLAIMLIKLERFKAGLRRKTMQVGDHRVVYSEGGKGEPVLLLHGFGASADNWNRFAARLKKRYRVVAPDLPGWGQSTRLEAESYGYAKQLERLRQFVTQLGFKRFHVVGHSMGGFMASAYAARYPEQILTVGLIAPHGIKEPESSELAQSVAAGDNWLVARSVPEFDRLLSKIFAQRPYIPKPVFKVLAQHAIRNSAKSARIFAEMQTNDPPLVKSLAQIKAPALIIWGDQDRVLHVSCSEVFHQGISNSELLVLPGIGHMPLVENARECAKVWMKFVEKARGAIGAAA